MGKNNGLTIVPCNEINNYNNKQRELYYLVAKEKVTQASFKQFH